MIAEVLELFAEVYWRLWLVCLCTGLQMLA